MTIVGKAGAERTALSRPVRRCGRFPSKVAPAGDEFSRFFSGRQIDNDREALLADARTLREGIAK